MRTARRAHVRVIAVATAIVLLAAACSNSKSQTKKTDVVSTPPSRLVELAQSGLPAVLVVSADARLPLKRFFEPSFPRLIVVSFQELPVTTEIENAGIVPLPLNLPRGEVVAIKAAA